MKKINAVCFVAAFVFLNVSFAEDVYLGQIDVVLEQNKTNSYASEYSSSNTLSREKLDSTPSKDRTIA